MAQTTGEVVVLENPAALAAEAARRVVALAQQAIATHGRFGVALSGGSTPRALHTLLAAPPLREQIDWRRVHIFWGDERFVPPDDPESNAHMARETLLDHVPVPAEQIYLAPTVGLPADQAAAQYSATLVAYGGLLPQLDLVLLGMGPDGHTASLFPGQPEPTTPGDELVIAVYDAPKPPPTRLSFSYRLINAAANVLFLVAGADKAATLRQVRYGPYDRARLPAQGVQPTPGRLTWLIEQAAAEVKNEE